MKLVVIHGSPRKGNTERLTALFLDKLKSLGEVDVCEYRMPQDVPDFCHGCLACVLRNESFCPHADRVRPILDAMLRADALVLTTPVYMMSMSGGLKNFLDHLPFLFLLHRPRPELFGKPVVILSTAAGGGMRPAMEDVARCTRYLGFGRIYRLGFAVRAQRLDAIPEKRRTKLDRKLTALAARFKNNVEQEKRHATLFSKIVFLVFRKLHRAGLDVPTDHAYWKEHGWLNGTNPFSASEMRKLSQNP